MVNQMKAAFYRTWLASLRMWGPLLVLSGCSMAPTYQKPQVGEPGEFKEARAESNPRAAPQVDDRAPTSEAGSWKPAQPSDHSARGAWWAVFADPALDDLEERALAANQGLRAAVARVSEARAINQSARAALFPTLDAGFGATRQKPSPASQGLSSDASTTARTLWRAQATAAYEVDLFGRVSDAIRASHAEAERSEALLRSVQLAVQADVAQNYFNLRAQDAELEVFARTVSLRAHALQLVQRRFDEGDVGEIDLARARSELATARSEEMAVQRLRAASEHGLAVLVGEAPARFEMPRKPIEAVDVRVPAGLPSSLLERRPDIAAAERSIAAANARIGVAKAAFFPSLSLTGTAGFEAGTVGNLFNWSSRAFALGPLAGTALNVPLFDGGRRKGDLANARAVYDEEVATYREQVLVAFREVEDSLSTLRILRDQRREQTLAETNALRAAEISSAQYTEGAVNYFEVIDSERAALQSQRASVQLVGAEAVATVNLIRALGGGWDTPEGTSPSPAAAIQDSARR
jgi:multidrug efflux system outer membrane protein